MTQLIKTNDGIFCTEVTEKHIRVYEVEYEEALQVASLYAQKYNVSIKYAAYNTSFDYHHFNITAK